MNRPPQIEVMFSSRSDDPIFDVWIHENDTASSAHNTFELSLKQIRRADIIIVLYTGEAGSAEGNAQIGICHAELQAALARRGEVVHIVELEPIKQTAEPTLRSDTTHRNRSASCH